MKAILVMVEKENTQVCAIKTILDAEKAGGPCAVLVLANGTAVVVNESAASMRAMLAEPVGCEMDMDPETGTPLTGMSSPAPLPRVSWHGLEPLAGACVRTLPTPQGARRFLCLPECDLAKPAGKGFYWAGQRHGVSRLWQMDGGEDWGSPFEFPFTAAFGPLPPVAP